MSTQYDPDTRRFTGRHMLLIMVAFFGLILSVNATMAYFAIGSWPGLVVPNSYIASQGFNEKLRDAARQADLGWTGALTYQEGAVVFDLRDHDGVPVRILSVTAKFGRPSSAVQDVRLELNPVAPGVAQLRHALAPGQWFADIEVRAADGKIWQKRWRLLVRAAGS
ncbi:MAG: FixH family protein [Alphaproteobacteria bacterium]|nr:FixH family protein [Alphaproteobacteria bacterium]